MFPGIPVPQVYGSQVYTMRDEPDGMLWAHAASDYLELRKVYALHQYVILRHKRVPAYTRDVLAFPADLVFWIL